MNQKVLDSALFLSACTELGIDISAGQLSKFEQFAALLCEWNQKMNLTAIHSPEGIALLHFADSLTLLAAVDIPKRIRMLDVGTGAGFPAVPVAIMREDIHLVMLDSLKKRLGFLSEVCKQLNLKADTLHARAEEAARQALLRDSFALVTARAVAPLNILCEYCLPFVKKDGIFAAMKGPSGDEELESANNALRELRAEVSEVRDFTLPDGSKRKIIIIKKLSNTPQKNPRQSPKKSKSPL